MAQISVLTGLKRGLVRRCPSCGEGRLFAGYLKVEAHCPACGVDNSVYPSDDAPPYFTALLVGHALVPLVLSLDKAWDPPLWVMLAVSLPTFAVATLATLPYVKGAVIGASAALGITRQSTASPF